VVTKERVSDSEGVNTPKLGLDQIRAFLRSASNHQLHSEEFHHDHVHTYHTQTYRSVY
jgi:hypothetical protein